MPFIFSIISKRLPMLLDEMAISYQIRTNNDCNQTIIPYKRRHFMSWYFLNNKSKYKKADTFR